jgi:hypothetical protein
LGSENEHPNGVNGALLPHRDSSAPVENSYDFFLSGRWVRADAAAVLEFLLVRPSLRVLEAAVPAFFPVCSFFAMSRSKEAHHLVMHQRKQSISSIVP